MTILFLAVVAAKWARFERWIDTLPRSAALVARAKPGHVEVVIFRDYQCPLCMALGDALRAPLETLITVSAGRVTLRETAFPLDRTCNLSVPASVHPLACDAEVAARLAARAGRKAEADGFLAAHEGDLTRDLLTQLLSDLALNELWRTSYLSVLSEVSQDTREGTEAGVKRTPTYYVNGIMALGNAQDILSVVRSQMK